jgi:hypothetical protein
MKPKNWKYKMSGKVNKLDIDSTFFPDTLSVEKGNLEGSKDRLTFTETQANILDASFTISGTLHEPFEGLGKTDLTGRGTFGPKTTEWFSDTINLPSEVRVRSPLSLTEANMSWERDGKTTFKGNFAFQRGADVSVELSTGPERMRNLMPVSCSISARRPMIFNLPAMSARQHWIRSLPERKF